MRNRFRTATSVQSCYGSNHKHMRSWGLSSFGASEQPSWTLLLAQPPDLVVTVNQPALPDHVLLRLPEVADWSGNIGKVDTSVRNEKVVITGLGFFFLSGWGRNKDVHFDGTRTDLPTIGSQRCVRRPDNWHRWLRIVAMARDDETVVSHAEMSAEFGNEENHAKDGHDDGCEGSNHGGIKLVLVGGVVAVLIQLGRVSRQQNDGWPVGVESGITVHCWRMWNALRVVGKNMRESALSLSLFLQCVPQ